MMKGVLGLSDVVYWDLQASGTRLNTEAIVRVVLL